MVACVTLVYSPRLLPPLRFMRGVQGWEGTAFQVWLWRISGARIGKGCCLFGGDRLEMDLLHLGDNVVVGEEAILQVRTKYACNAAVSASSRSYMLAGTCVLQQAPWGTVHR